MPDLSSAVEPMDEGGNGFVLFILVTLAFFADLFVCAFVYKVWNERQMTHEYHEQAVQQKRIADEFEFFANEASEKTANVVPIRNTVTLGCVGGHGLKSEVCAP